MSIHDALTYLPRTRILEFPKRCPIYDAARPPENLYLVLTGRVKIYSTAENGMQTLLRIVTPEGFFGEASLVPTNGSFHESAMALDSTQVMCWSAEKLTEYIESEPRLDDVFAAVNLQQLRLKNDQQVPVWEP